MGRWSPGELYWWHARLLRLLDEAGTKGLRAVDLAMITGDLVTDVRRHLTQLGPLVEVDVAGWWQLASDPVVEWERAWPACAIREPPVIV